MKRKAPRNCLISLTALFFLFSYNLSCSAEKGSAEKGNAEKGSAEKGSAEKVQPTGPYETLRDYIAALEARGKILRIKEVDQDKYEGTAFVYRMLDEKGLDTSPGLMFEKVKIDGEWRESPMYANLYCGWETAAMVYGVENITDNQGEM